MIRRSVKVQLLAFVVVSLLGVAFVGLRYVGLGNQLFGGSYVAHADFADSGGIFTGAEVTYRGVGVGRVGQLHLLPNGVRADLVLNGGTKIPANASAVVADRSAVGEQYINLVPTTNQGPYLRSGSVIPQNRTSTPLPVTTLLLNLDKLVNSVNRQDLTTVIDELGKAFNGLGPDLARMIYYGNALTESANANITQTIRLIQDGKTVLDTQRASASDIKRWAAALASLSDQLRASDPDLRRLFANGPPAATQLVDLFNGLQPNLGTLLANLIVVGNIQNLRLANLQQILVTYPAVTTGGFSVVQDINGTWRSRFGMVSPMDSKPGPCYQSYPSNPSCTNAELAAGSGQRSDRTVPAAGTTGGQQAVMGSASWQWMLLGPLAGN